jgi:RNA polymerase sigma-70 factor (ECF subfamily)
MRLDPSEFERLVIDHQRVVFSIALHSTRNRALAEEITQEVFLALYRNLESIESPAHLVFWLRRVTATRCIDMARRQRLRRWLLLGSNEPVAPAKSLGDPFVSERLARLIAGLPVATRTVLVLRYQQDLEVVEIAQTLNMPPQAVKRHLRKALEHLRLRMKPIARSMQPLHARQQCEDR